MILRKPTLPVGRDDLEETVGGEAEKVEHAGDHQGVRQAKASQALVDRLEIDQAVDHGPQHEDPDERVRQRQPCHQQVGRLPRLALADQRVQHQAVQQQDEGRQDELKQETSCQFPGGPSYLAPGRSAPG